MLLFFQVLLLAWAAFAVIYATTRALKAFGSALDRRLNQPPPRSLSRDERERARHDAFMAGERERLDGPA